jgi:hypothetical protein
MGMVDRYAGWMDGKLVALSVLLGPLRWLIFPLYLLFTLPIFLFIWIGETFEFVSEAGNGDRR